MPDKADENWEGTEGAVKGWEVVQTQQVTSKKDVTSKHRDEGKEVSVSYPASTVRSAVEKIVESAEESEAEEVEEDEKPESLEAKVASKVQHDQSPKNVEEFFEQQSIAALLFIDPAQYHRLE